MPKSDHWREGQLQLILQNIAFPDLGDATGLPATSTAGSLFIGLHVGAPSPSGTQDSNEADYTSYVRVAVARSNAVWDVTGNLATNISEVTFPEATGGNNTVTHASIGLESAGATEYLYSGELDTPRVITSGVEPRFKPGEIKLTEL